MNRFNGNLFFKFFTFVGFMLFFLKISRFYFPIAVLFILYIFSLLFDFYKKKKFSTLFYYFSSGLLIIPMRAFYWDSFDFDLRIKYLFYLSLAFSIITILKKIDFIHIFLKWFNIKTLKKKIILIFLFAEIIFIFASYVNVKKGVVLVGDEPHYLVIAQSIAKDGDLNVFNQYARDIYREFIDYRLAHHTKVGKGFKKWYSFHLPGLAVTLAPFFIFKLPIPLLYFLIRIYLGLFGALISVFIYLISIKLLKRDDLSLFITLVFSFTSPMFFFAFHIFSEGQVVLLLLLSFYLGMLTSKKKDFYIFLSGFFLGISVFWGLKYIIFIGIFCLLFLIRSLRERQYKEAFLFIISPLFFIVLFFAFLFFAYGNFSPMSIYTGVMTKSQMSEYYSGIKSISLKNRIETILDYFFDQRDGLLLYNPFYFFFFPGLILALKKIKKYSGVFLVSIAPFVYILYHGYSTVRPGFCPQARYLVPVMWVLMLYSVIYYLESENRLIKKIFLYIPFYSFFIVIFQIFNPFTLYQTTTHNYLDRGGLLFQKLSNICFDLSGFLPSFAKIEGNRSYLPNIFFAIIFILFIFISLKKSKRSFKIRSGVILFLILFVLLSLFPRISLYNPIKVRTQAGLPFLVHGNLYPKRDIKSVFESDLSEDQIVTLSTVKRLKRIILKINGYLHSEKLPMVFCFDKKASVISDEYSAVNRFVVDAPVFKKFRGRYYYSLRFISNGISNKKITAEIIPE